MFKTKMIPLLHFPARCFLILIYLAGFNTIFSVPALANETSRHLDKIESINFPAVPAPEGPVELGWLFKPGNNYLYNYEQDLDFELTVVNLRDADPQTMMQKAKASGNLKVLSENNEQAKIELQTGIKGTMTSTLGDNETFSDQFPVYTIDNVDIHGNFPTVDPSADLAIKTTLSLPDKPLKVGESSHKTVQAYFNVADKPILVDCALFLELAGYVNCNGNTCAQINILVRNENFTPPPGLLGEYQPYVSGKGKAFFDINKRKFVQSSMAMLMVMNAKNIPTLPETEEEAKLLREKPEFADALVKMDNFIQFTGTKPGTLKPEKQESGKQSLKLKKE